MKRFLLPILALISFSGCASITVTPPLELALDRTRTYRMPFEKVWTRAVDWYADHNVIIEKIEKPSGLLTAKYLLKVGDRDLNCGRIEASGIDGELYIEKYGRLNVTVRAVNDNETKVNVNLFGEYKLQALDAWDHRLVTATGRCVSAGTLENNILSYIERQN